MSETQRDTENEFERDVQGRTPYLIQLGKVVYGNSPGEATDEFMTLVALEGLSSQNVRAWDLVDDIQYVVTPTGWIESAEIEDEEITSEEYLAALDAIAENAESLPNRFIEEGDGLDDYTPVRQTVDVELPEESEDDFDDDGNRLTPADAIEPEAKQCTRCKETHPLNEAGLCAHCVADLEGVA